jgi:hypothetical protein
VFTRGGRIPDSLDKREGFSSGLYDKLRWIDAGERIINSEMQDPTPEKVVPVLIDAEKICPSPSVPE